MNRRLPLLSHAVLAATLATVLGCTPAAPPAAQPTTPPATLKAAYRDDFLVGAAINQAVADGRDAASQALVLRQFDTITAENELKPERVLPRPGEYDFAPGDAVVAFGRAHGMFVVGHTLLWHVQTPPWLFVDGQGRAHGADAQIERLRDYIEHVAGRYAGKVQGWDVANEVIGDDGNYRDSPWLRNVGDGDRLVREAFRFAARYAPDTELYYNDYGTENPLRREGIVRMVKMLQADGLRIDGIGMQGHWGIDSPSIAEIEQSIDAFAALGVKVMITELDIDVLPHPPVADGMRADEHLQLPDDPVQRQRLDPWPQGLPADMQDRLARRYADLFALFHRKRAAISRVTFWNVHDGASWKNDFPVRGRTNYPLLFDRNAQPKPAFEAVLAIPAQAAPDR